MKKPSAKPTAATPVVEESTLYSLSRLAGYFELDRATVRRRLKEAGVTPVVEQAKKKLYRLEDAVAAVEQAAAVTTGKTELDQLEQARLRKLKAETSLKELELSSLQGEMVPRKKVESDLYKLFAALYQRLAVRMPKELGPQLAKADSVEELRELLQTTTTNIFQEIRRDHHL